MSTHPEKRTFGKYIVTRSLGRGGMADVYLAQDPVLDRQVAIKVILPHLAGEEGFDARFLREAKLIASLRHPHIVQIFDFAVLDEQPFMVMEFLAGETLKSRLSSLRSLGEWMALDDAAHLLDSLAAALDYAHAQGAIHRDVKPGNILFTGQNELVLTDFGIARLVEGSGEHSLTGGDIVGTPAYMSPEQAAGRAVDRAGDLYALGVVAYELATGRVPFVGDSPTAVLMQHITDTPPRPRTLNPNLPAPVEAVLLRALEKEPGERYPSGQAFAQALRSALSGRVEAAVSIEDATLIGPSQTGSAVTPAQSSAPWPAPPQPPADRPLFVAREQELARLQAFLQRALTGQGQVCFVTGEAGAGKTALTGEFARRAQAAYPQLVVVTGNCNTQSGVGDPYLPFREILTRLLGVTTSGPGLEATLPEENVQSVHPAEPAGRALAEHGPDLIDIFVPGDLLLAQMPAQADERSGWMERLERLVQRKAQAGETGTGVEQGHILEQYTNVLTALARQQPLLLVIDDLQWVDTASAALLFHLSRRIDDSPITLLGTYRPDEVALGRGGQAHPLEKVQAELKRYRGDIQIELRVQDAETGRHFVDSLLDAEPNRLGADFRRALFQHTGGHALFAVELLRTMQDRGDLTQDATGRWQEEPTLDWTQLPPRVEGVIEERIARLAEELREMLTVASIEGEDFTAEVVARVQQVDARGLIRQLSRELEQQHRLVGAVGSQRIGRQRLSRFRFQHNLFQKYLYNHLNPVERAYFHEDVGAVLEELYADNTDAIAVQLAWHFSEADVPEKARRYLASAGEQAQRRYASAEALDYLSRALALTAEDEPTGRYRLLLARQAVYDLLSDRDNQRRDLERLEALAAALDDPRRQAEVALARTLHADRIGAYQESAAHAQRAIELAAAVPDVEQEATGYQRWGRALLNLSDYGESQTKLERALALAEAEKLPRVKADSLRSLGVVAYFLGDFDAAAENYEAGLALYQALGDRRSEAHSLSNLGLSFRERGRYADARAYFDRALASYEEIGDQDGAAHALVNLGLLGRDQGDMEASRDSYNRALAICRRIGARAAEGLALLGLGDVHKDQDAYSEAIALYEEALHIFRAIGDRREEYLAGKELANVNLYVGQFDRARQQYEDALAAFREIGDRQSESSTLNRLGLLYYLMGEPEASRANSQAALAIAQEIGDRWIEASSLTKLGHGLAGLGQTDAAGESYGQAVALWRELGRPDLALESMAGLARLARAAGDRSGATAYAEEMLAQFADDSFSNDGMAEEFLTCYRVLRAADDPRAAAILQEVHGQIQTAVARMDDEAMRRSYLENIPAVREIVEEWGRFSER